MSKKFSDLNYYMQNLISSIDDIENKELRDRLQGEFYTVDDLIRGIETDLSGIQYELGELI